MVGVAGLEPTTPCPPDRCATGLRYTPTPRRPGALSLRTRAGASPSTVTFVSEALALAAPGRYGRSPFPRFPLEDHDAPTDRLRPHPPRHPPAPCEPVRDRPGRPRLRRATCSRARGRASALVSTGLGPRVLDRAQALAGSSRRSRPAGSRTWRPTRTRSTAAWRRGSRGRAGGRPRRRARPRAIEHAPPPPHPGGDRCSTSCAPRRSRPCREGSLYLHTSHLRLDKPERFDWLYTRARRAAGLLRPRPDPDHPSRIRPAGRGRAPPRCACGRSAGTRPRILVNSADTGERTLAHLAADGFGRPPLAVGHLGVEPAFGRDRAALRARPADLPGLRHHRAAQEPPAAAPALARPRRTARPGHAPPRARRAPRLGGGERRRPAGALRGDPPARRRGLGPLDPRPRRADAQLHRPADALLHRGLRHPDRRGRGLRRCRWSPPTSRSTARSARASPTFLDPLDGPGWRRAVEDSEPSGVAAAREAWPRRLDGYVAAELARAFRAGRRAARRALTAHAAAAGRELRRGAADE